MPRPRKSTLRSITLADLAAEMTRRQGELPALRAREAEITEEMATLTATIGALDGATGRRVPARRVGRGIGRVAKVAAPMVGRKRGRRTKNGASLSEALVKVLTGKTMSVTDVATAVKKSGYKSTSANFRTMVNIALLNKKKFKRVERGMYTAV
jgi:hypothetical protein